MHCAVMADVHSNLEALEAVLKDIEKREAADIIFLGDAVGYGPDPNKCIDVLRDACRVLIAGNHDRAATCQADIEYFNEYAKAAVLWTREELSEENKGFIEALPLTAEMKDDGVLLVHSTPKEPEAWHYLLTLWDAEINFNYFDQRICMLGHSHQPFVIERLPSDEMVIQSKEISLGSSARYILNAGSVGQPRDRDPRACYMMIDGEKVEFVRIAYDIEKTQKKMHDSGLPLPLIERLARGA